MGYTGKNEATKEAYVYYNENIAPLKYIFDETDGYWKTIGAGHNDQVDAFRHAYVSGIYTLEIGESAANILGQLNEVKGTILDQPEAEKNMDLWNNRVGRKVASDILTAALNKSEKWLGNSKIIDVDMHALKEELGKALKSALLDGKLIITTDQEKDSRQYDGDIPVTPSDPEKPVVVIKENETGRNELFLDLVRGNIMDRDQFVSEIESGIYPGYLVAKINNIPTPMSKADSNPGNNLG